MRLALEELANCSRCALCETRTQVVVGSGDVHADTLFIGEAPGRNEDEGGAPFIGAAGKVLDAFLEAAALTRDEIYITNVVKCRPPKNRNPKNDEIAACAPWLKTQIDELAPRVIVPLGAFATHWILECDAAMGELAGVPHEISWGEGAHARTICVVPVYHPAATIYNQKLRAPFLESAHVVRAVIDSAQTECAAVDRAPGDAGRQ